MSKIKKETVIRTALLLLALINLVLETTGHSVIPVTNDQISEFISIGFTILTSIWAWWKNNSFTKEAITADNYLAKMKEVNKEVG